MDAESIVLDPRKMRCRRLRRTITEAARLHESHTEWDSRRLGRSAYRKTFITLTYRHRGEWERRHISRFVRLMRQWFQRRDHACRFVWVAELQKRGALHYHLVVWVPRRLRLPRPDVCGWWPHGSSKIETARNPIGYMVKYATKTTPDALKRLPKGVRLHGNGGHNPHDRVHLRETLMPSWVHDHRDEQRFAHYAAEEADRQAWEQRRIEVRTPQPDGTTHIRFVDPELPPEGSDAWWELRVAYEERRIAEEEQWCAYVAKYAAKGLPSFVRVSGGMVDLRTGELIPTPWRVEYAHGALTITKKTELHA
jgi:hypothetical protein